MCVSLLLGMGVRGAVCALWAAYVLQDACALLSVCACLDACVLWSAPWHACWHLPVYVL